MSNNIELSDLHRLLELAKSDTYTEAAYHLNISESHLRRIVRKLENSVGFKLIGKSSGSPLALTKLGKNWIQSFSEFHRSLKQLDQSTANILSTSQNLAIGISPTLALTDNLWNYLASLHPACSFNCRAEADIDMLKGEEFDSLIDTQQHELTDNAYISQLLYQEELSYYHLTHLPPSLKEDHITIILQQPASKFYPDSLLHKLSPIPDKKVHFIEASNAREALHLVSLGHGIFPSLKLNSEIIPDNIKSSPFLNPIVCSIYLTSHRKKPFKLKQKNNSFAPLI